jgi:dTMP kinase
MAEVFLFLADRANHYEEVVEPNRGTKIVISDRGYISGISYAWATNNLNFDELVNLNKIALKNNQPDKIIFLKTTSTLLEERLGAKVADGIESRGISYLIWVQTCMETTIHNVPVPVLCIDIVGKTREEILKEAKKFIWDEYEVKN